MIRQRLMLFGVVGVLAMVLPSSAWAGIAGCLHIRGLTTYDKPHLVVHNHRNETVKVELLPDEFGLGKPLSWQVAAKKDDVKFYLNGLFGAYSRVKVTGNGWSDYAYFYPSYTSFACNNDYWAIRVVIMDKPKVENGQTYNIMAGYRFKN